MSTITVTLRLIQMTEKKKSRRIVAFSYLKNCGSERLGATPFLGLFVGTKKNDPNVIANGDLTPEWIVDNSTDTTGMIIPGAQTSITFWVTLSENKHRPPIILISVYVDDENIVEVRESGALSGGQTKHFYDGYEPKDLTLTFRCRRKGTSEVTVTAKSTHDQDVSAAWTLTKMCQVAQRNEGTSIIGLHVGLTTADKSVVENGVTLPKFSNALSSADEETKIMYVVAPSTDQMRFTVWYTDAGLSRGVRFRKPILVATRSLLESGEHVAVPTIKGSIQNVNVLAPGKAVDLILEFNCVRNGTTDVTVQIPLAPSGQLQWVVEKQCNFIRQPGQVLPADEPELTPITGLHVGAAIRGSNIVFDGIPQPHFHWDTDVRDLKFIPATKLYTTFYFSKNHSVDDNDVTLGVPELISTLDVASPTISGRGSDGGVLVDGNYLTVTITYHCLSNGTTHMTLTVPILPNKLGESPPRAEPITMAFLKECTMDPLDPYAGAGGVGIQGFSVGFKATTNELVFNGFPQPMYYGQRNKAKPSWGPAIIKEDVKSTAVYIHYNSLKGTSTVGETVEFQSPVAVTHGPILKPELSGPAAAGGALVLDGDPLELDITYNCQYKGLSSVTIQLAILPHGSITFTIPKQCAGKDVPEGARISGLSIGTKKGGNDVVKDGLTQDDFTQYLAHEMGNYIVFDASSTFWVQKSGDVFTGLEPMIFSHRPICNPRISHKLHVSHQKGANAFDETVEIVIDDKPATLNISYNCVFRGESAVTLTIPALPSGRVSFTWTIVCGDDDYYYYYDQYRYVFDDDDYAIDDFGPSSDYDDVMSDDFDDDGGFFRDIYRYDDYMDYFDYYFEDDYYDLPDDYAHSYEDWDDWDETHWNPHLPTEFHSMANPPLGFVNIGTGTEGDYISDVVEGGQAQRQFSLPVKENDLEENVYTVVSRYKESTTFYISVPQGYQGFLTPNVRAQKNRKGIAVADPKLSGAASFGGNLTAAGGAFDLTITYGCLTPGVTPILVTIPYTPQALGATAFRVVKVCSNFKQHVEWYWTAQRVLILCFVILAVLGGLIGLWCHRRAAGAKKAGGGSYQPVATSVAAADRDDAAAASTRVPRTAVDDLDDDSD